MNARDARHLERALNVAALSTERHKHGAVIALGAKVLAVGVNTHRSHPSVCTDPKTQAAFHAEVSALRSLRTTVDTSRLTVYSARINTNGEPMLAKPCTACQTVLDFYGIRRVLWTSTSVTS